MVFVAALEQPPGRWGSGQKSVKNDGLARLTSEQGHVPLSLDPRYNSQSVICVQWVDVERMTEQGSHRHGDHAPGSVLWEPVRLGELWHTFHDLPAQRTQDPNRWMTGARSRTMDATETWPWREGWQWQSGRHMSCLPGPLLLHCRHMPRAPFPFRFKQDIGELQEIFWFKNSKLWCFTAQRKCTCN